MATLPPVRIGLLGLGTVGGGTVTVLRRNALLIAARAGRTIEVACASARTLDKPRSVDLRGITLHADPQAVVDDPTIDIVVELIGGIEPARGLVLRALANGKHVVTANKALIALHGNEIFAAAQARGLMVAFEAAVAGGIPVIKVMREGFAGNDIQWLAGIINGTCNFILSAMSDEGGDFDEVLAEAQRLGYAEADPSFDVDGIDAAHKLMILASLGFGIPLQFAKVHVEGIRRVSREDVAFAARLGYRIKHLGIARRQAQGIELRVHPAFVPARAPLANVNGVMNGVMVRGDAAGPVLLSGAGAGAEPTASSVVADLVDVVRALTSDPGNRVPHLAFQPDTLENQPILDIADTETAYYVRLHVADEPGVLADVTRILADLGISIEAIMQLDSADDAPMVPVVILTHVVKERAMNAAIARIEALPAVRAPLNRIRVEPLA
ncbi:MAG: homoserine dehydrogenase [Gammaproteobacteria bacterium]|nr:homoserine dehydrogenase [Gammaproteobacteria bacterium]